MKLTTFSLQSTWSLTLILHFTQLLLALSKADYKQITICPAQPLFLANVCVAANATDRYYGLRQVRRSLCNCDG